MMTKTGPAPMPTVVRMLKGNPGKRPLPKNEPKPKADRVKMPPGLSDAAKKHWKTVAKQLHDTGLLTNIDVHALQMYCEAFARWQGANDRLAIEGTVVMTPNGYPVASPYIAISNKAFDQMKGIMTEFGMTPASRTRIQVKAAESEDADELGALLGRRNK